jgi:hypothetical protein
MIFIELVFFIFFVICKEYSNPITDIESADPTILKVDGGGILDR